MKNKGLLLTHGAISSFTESTQPRYTYIAYIARGRQATVKTSGSPRGQIRAVFTPRVLRQNQLTTT